MKIMEKAVTSLAGIVIFPFALVGFISFFLYTFLNFGWTLASKAELWFLRKIGKIE